MTLQASKTCKVWITLNPSVFFSGCLRIPDGISHFFSLFLNSNRVFSMIFTLIHCCWMPFTTSCFLFYSVILRFSGYHWFPLFVLLGTETNVVSTTLVVGPFLILHYFLLLRFPLQMTPADLPVMGCPRRLAFGLSSSKASRFYLFRPTFWLLFPLSFFPSELIPSCQVERSPTTFPYGSSSWVPRGTRPFTYGLLVLKPSDTLSASLGGW